MQREKKTKISITEDFPVSFSSTVYGANLNGVAFNIEYIMYRDPVMAAKITKLSSQAQKLRGKEKLDSNDPKFEKAWQTCKTLFKSKNW